MDLGLYFVFNCFIFYCFSLSVFLVTHTIGDLTVDFRWKRLHLFDQLLCRVLYEKCIEQPIAKVEKVQSKPKSKWRPLPLDTVVSFY